MPRMDPGAKEPRAPASGPNVRAKPFGLPFRRLEKVTRRKGGTLLSHHPKNGYSHSPPNNLVGPQAAKAKKKGNRSRPKCLACSSIQKNHFLRLFASFQIKNPNPAKNRTMRPTVSTPAKTTLSKNMTGLLNLLCCDGTKLTKHAGAIIDQDQVRPTQNAKEGK